MKNRRFSMIMALVFLFSAIAPGLVLAAEYTPEAAAEAVQEELDGAFRGEDTAAEARPAVIPSEEGSVEEAGVASEDNSIRETETADETVSKETAEVSRELTAEEDQAELQDFIPSYGKGVSTYQVEVSGGTVGPFLNPYRVSVDLGTGKRVNDYILFPEPVAIRNNSGFSILVSAEMSVLIPEGSRVETVASPEDLAEPGIRMFSWFEFVNSTGRKIEWSGKYTGGANQVANGRKTEDIVEIPDGGVAYAMLFGRFAYPTGDMWMAGDTADFGLRFTYAPAPDAVMNTPAAVPVTPSGPKAPNASLPVNPADPENNIPEAAIGEAETAPETVEAAPETAENAPETTEAAPETAENAPETAEAAPETAEATPETAEAAPETAEAAPETAETAESVSTEVGVPQTAEVFDVWPVHSEEASDPPVEPAKGGI